MFLSILFKQEFLYCFITFFNKNYKFLFQNKNLKMKYLVITLVVGMFSCALAGNSYDRSLQDIIKERCKEIHGTIGDNSSSLLNRGCVLQCGMKNKTALSYLPDGSRCPGFPTFVCSIFISFSFFALIVLL